MDLNLKIRRENSKHWSKHFLFFNLLPSFPFHANEVTLYLVLFVEFVRHNIDHAARGRPFFTAVLTMAYSECKKLSCLV
jgi:hypothetical protein